MTTLNHVKVKICKPDANLEYLKQRLEEERAPVRPMIEYYCNTCRTNLKMKELAQFEESRSKMTFIPSQFRMVLKDIGIVFTKSSYLFDAHNTNFKEHDWGMYQPEIKSFVKNA